MFLELKNKKKLRPALGSTFDFEKSPLKLYLRNKICFYLDSDNFKAWILFNINKNNNFGKFKLLFYMLPVWGGCLSGRIRC